MCERTLEYLQFVNSHSHQIAPLQKKILDGPKSKSAFHDAAAEIARGIHRTSGILTKLTKLVKQQGLFDDPTEEINNLIYRIKQDLVDLNTKCDTAQQFVGNNKKNEQQSAAYNVKVVDQLKSELMTATKDFKNVLEVRSSKMKDQQQRKVQLTGMSALSPMKQFQGAQSAPNSALKSNGISSNGDSIKPTQLFSGGGMAMRNPYDMELESPANSHHHYAGDFSSQNNNFQEQQLLLAPPSAAQYYESREEAVTEVEKTIGELSTLFKRLATMISEQQELVERIDEDVENAVSNTESAHQLLLKTYENVSSNRAMYTKIAAILGIFFLFFVIFLM